MHLPHTSFKNTAGCGALVSGASWNTVGLHLQAAVPI